MEGFPEFDPPIQKLHCVTDQNPSFRDGKGMESWGYCIGLGGVSLLKPCEPYPVDSTVHRSHPQIASYDEF